MSGSCSANRSRRLASRRFNWDWTAKGIAIAIAIAARSDPDRYLIAINDTKDPITVRTTICSGGIATSAMPSSHLKRCHRVLPRNAFSVPLSMLAVSCAVGRPLASRTTVGTDTNSAILRRTVPFLGPETSALAPVPIKIAVARPTATIVANELHRRLETDG